jgi:hypothetical protein
LKSRYRNGRIGAAEQAEARYNAVAEVLEVLDDDDDDDIIEIQLIAMRRATFTLSVPM